MNKLKPLLSLPILAILFVSFSCEEELISETTPVITEAEIVDETEIPILIEIQDNSFSHQDQALVDLETVIIEETPENVFVSELPSGETIELIVEEIPESELERKVLLKETLETIREKTN